MIQQHLLLRRGHFPVVPPERHDEVGAGGIASSGGGRVLQRLAQDLKLIGMALPQQSP